jgi:hypothetical protein
MPNWSTNMMTVKGNADKVYQFYQQNAKYEDGKVVKELDFELAVPFPAHWSEQQKHGRVGSDEFGGEQWYNWCIAHWGTKWGAFDVKVEFSDEMTLCYIFKTAWDPPLKWLEKAWLRAIGTDGVAHDLIIELRYTSEGEETETVYTLPDKYAPPLVINGRLDPLYGAAAFPANDITDQWQVD